MMYSGPTSREVTITLLAILVAAALGTLAGLQGTAVFALPLVLVGIALLFIRPVLGLFLLAATIPMEAALMVQGRSAPALIAMAVFAVWATQRMVRKDPLRPLISPAFVHVALVFFAFACLSMLWSQYPQGLERRLLLLFQLVLLSVLVFDLTSSWERVAWVAKLLVLATTIAALLTIEQYYIGGVRRAGQGIVGGINRTAITMVMILPFAFYLIRSTQESTAWRLLGLAYIALAGLAIAATMSRMNFLLYPLVIFAHLALMARTPLGRRRVVLLGGAAVLLMSLLPMDAVRERAETITPYLAQSLGSEAALDTQTARGYTLRMSMAIFRDHPILGAGYQSYSRQFVTYQWEVPGNPLFRPQGYSPHNSHLAFLANLGIVGFLLWMSLFAVATTYLLRAARAVGKSDNEMARFLVHAIAVAVGLLFLYGFYAEIHQDKLFWFVMGLSVAVYRLSEQALVPWKNPNETYRTGANSRMSTSPWSPEL